MLNRTFAAFAFVLAACAPAAADRGPVPIDTTVHPIRTAKPSAAVLKQELTPLQYAVTQNDDTEPPFRNAYFDNHAAGLYVDVTTGQPLFSSENKFESGTGWPSFDRPIDPTAIVEKRDGSLGVERVEIRSKIGDAHLGHVFDDGPTSTHLRYCMNSAALRFVPVEQLAAHGYGAYAARFANR